MRLRPSSSGHHGSKRPSLPWRTYGPGWTRRPHAVAPPWPSPANRERQALVRLIARLGPSLPSPAFRSEARPAWCSNAHNCSKCIDQKRGSCPTESLSTTLDGGQQAIWHFSFDETRQFAPKRVRHARVGRDVDLVSAGERAKASLLPMGRPHWTPGHSGVVRTVAPRTEDDRVLREPC